MKNIIKNITIFTLCVLIFSVSKSYATEGDPGISDHTDARVPLHLQAENSTTAVELPWYKKKKFWIGATVVAATTAVIATTWAISKSSSCDTSPTPSSLSSFSEADEALFPAKKCYDYIYENFPSIRDKGYNLASTIYSYGRSMVSADMINADWTCRYFGIQDQFNTACCYNPTIPTKSVYKYTITHMIHQKWNCSALTTTVVGIWKSFSCTGDN